MTVPTTKGGIQVNRMFRHIMTARKKLDPTWTTAWTGIIDIGGITDAMTATSAAPPPRPNAAETAEVRKLRRHRATKDHSETPGALARMSWMTDMEERHYTPLRRTDGIDGQHPVQIHNP